jgi:hypothetical protein
MNTGLVLETRFLKVETIITSLIFNCDVSQSACSMQHVEHGTSSTEYMKRMHCSNLFLSQYDNETMTIMIVPETHSKQRSANYTSFVYYGLLTIQSRYCIGSQFVWPFKASLLTLWTLYSILDSLYSILHTSYFILPHPLSPPFLPPLYRSLISPSTNGYHGLLPPPK